MTILDEIAAYTRQRMADEEQQLSTAQLERKARAMADAELKANGGTYAFPFSAALAAPGRLLRRALSRKSFRIWTLRKATKRRGRLPFPALPSPNGF